MSRSKEKQSDRRVCLQIVFRGERKDEDEDEKEDESEEEKER